MTHTAKRVKPRPGQRQYQKFCAILHKAFKYIIINLNKFLASKSDQIPLNIFKFQNINPRAHPFCLNPLPYYLFLQLSRSSRSFILCPRKERK